MKKHHNFSQLDLMLYITQIYELSCWTTKIFIEQNSFNWKHERFIHWTSYLNKKFR